jgi:hypothetical protein
MSKLRDDEYHERREAQERERATQAAEDDVRKIHHELAEQHARKGAQAKTKLGLFKER